MTAPPPPVSGSGVSPVSGPGTPPVSGSGAPTGSPTSAGPATSPPRAGRLSLRNMVLSMAILLLPLLAVVLFFQSLGDGVTTVDPAPAIGAARAEAGYTVLAPTGLPDGWRPTSSGARSEEPGSFALRIGYVTPDGDFVQYVQSDEAPEAFLARELAEGARPSGVVDVDGRPWQRYPGRASGETALVLLTPGSTVLVTGSAGDAELTELATSLR